MKEKVSKGYNYSRGMVEQLAGASVSRVFPPLLQLLHLKQSTSARVLPA